MPLIDTDQIAKQFGQQAANLIEKLSTVGMQDTTSLLNLLETKDLVITIQLKERV